MMLLTGQPLLQNGVPQSMHRADCVLACCVVQADDELLVSLHALGDGLVALFDALKLHEAGDFSHDAVPSIVRSLADALRYLGWRMLPFVWQPAALAPAEALRPLAALRALHFAQGALVFVGEDLHKLGAGVAPVVQQIAGTLAARPAVVVFQTAS